MTLPLRVIVNFPGANGVPSTSPMAQLQRRINSYQHTICSTGWYESCDVTFTATKGEAETWLTTGLIGSVVVSDPDGLVCWEGVVVGVDASLGQEQRSVNLEAMQNRIRTRYTTVLGTPGTTTTASEADSIARYGTKDGVLSIGKSTATAAANIRDAELNRKAWPRAVPTSSAGSGDMGSISITLHCAGWYYLLDWLVTSSTTTSTAVTTAQVQTLLTAYNSTNNFFSTTYIDIVASGLSETQAIAPDTTYREAIESRLKLGTSAGERMAWGVAEGRRFFARTWAGASPTQFGYRRQLNSPYIRTSGGARVMPWAVVPDTMYTVTDLVDIDTYGADTAGRYYVERVTCSISGGQVSVSLEPGASDGFDARLARLK